MKLYFARQGLKPWAFPWCECGCKVGYVRTVCSCGKVVPEEMRRVRDFINGMLDL